MCLGPLKISYPFAPPVPPESMPVVDDYYFLRPLASLGIGEMAYVSLDDIIIDEGKHPWLFRNALMSHYQRPATSLLIKREAGGLALFLKRGHAWLPCPIPGGRYDLYVPIHRLVY